MTRSDPRPGSDAADGTAHGDGPARGDPRDPDHVASAGDDDAYAVPPDAPVVECPRCGRPFARERHRDLHVGVDHADLDADERAAYEAASEDERAELRRFRIVSLGLLVALYFGFLFLYAVVG